jgi:uncharacterized protein (DUF1330 family)
MATVNPTDAQIEDFRRVPDDAPIVMLNLLRFRDQADAPQGGTGKQAYARYSKAVLPLLLEVGGYPIWMGKARYPFIAPEGEAWDEVLLVYYPSRRAFLRMVESDAYQRAMPHRTAALADSRLVETVPSRVPRAVLRAAGLAARAKALLFPAIR